MNDHLEVTVDEGDHHRTVTVTFTPKLDVAVVVEDDDDEDEYPVRERPSGTLPRRSYYTRDED